MCWMKKMMMTMLEIETMLNRQAQCLRFFCSAWTKKMMMMLETEIIVQNISNHLAGRRLRWAPWGAGQ